MVDDQQLRLIGIVYLHEPISIGEAAEKMELSASRSSRVAKSLVQIGLLARTPLEADERVHALTITKKGLRTWKRLTA